MIGNTKLIIFSFLLSIGFTNKGAYAQKNDSLIKRFKKQSLIVSSNGIYNYFTNKTVINMVNPFGKVPNSSQTVYYWQYKYYDTYTFDLSVQYNKFLSKKFSISTGLRFDQLKSIQKTILYIDSSSYLPDLQKLTRSEYSISVPVLGNFYLKRFKFNFGLYAYFFTISKSVDFDEYDVKTKYSKSYFYKPDFFAQESVAFKLLKKREIYLQLGIFHSLNFKNNYGYNKFFTLGVCFESPRL
jgi:hypothetical protein